MFHYSKRSVETLESCVMELQVVFLEVIKHLDCSLICGYRNARDQNIAFESQKSRVRYPDSKHNIYPSRAIDAVPFPINWDNSRDFIYMAGLVRMVGISKGIKIRWGGDWDEDFRTSDQRFNDYAHYEIAE